MDNGSKISVAVMRTQDDVLAELIALEVKQSRHFVLNAAEQVAAEDVDRLESAVDGADLLIAIGDFDARLMQDLVGRYPQTIISFIRIGADTVHVTMKRSGIQHFLDTLHALARGRTHESRRLVGFRVVETNGGDCDLLELRPDRLAVIDAASEWVRQALLSYWSRLPKTEFDMLGHARSSDAFADLLSRQSASPAAEDEVLAFARLHDALADSQNGNSSALLRLHLELGLDELELKLFLLALAPELDVRFQVAFGMLNDDLGRRRPTYGLACAVLGKPMDIRSSVEQTGRLFRWQLIEGGRTLYADDLLRVPSSICAWLIGNDDAILADPAVAMIIRAEPYAGAELMSAVEGAAVARDLATWFASREGGWITPPSAHLDRWRARCEQAAAISGSPLLRVETGSIAGMTREQQQHAVTMLARAARLMNMIPVFDFLEATSDAAGLALMQIISDIFAGFAGPAVLLSADIECYLGILNASTIVAIRLPNNAEPPCSDLFAAATQRAGISLSRQECERLGLAFSLSVDKVEGAVTLAALDGANRGDQRDNFTLLARACRRISSPRLIRLARRVEPTFSLDDVVLPEEQHRQLREIVNNVAHAHTVLTEWGFSGQLPYGRGVVALFSGPSGTGKTMASQAIACALGTEVFLVDLSRVVSKYIGETEKNLDAIFEEAERANALIQVDEADCSFGRRGEQKDGHDRYANLEVAYLLQRVESFSGLAILTTNLKQNVDPAFMRRLRFVVDFPKPDAAAREAIWRRCLPEKAPLAPGLDFSFLARQVDITGGNIRQITLRAAFAAASEGQPIDMRHIFAATRAELIKLGATGAIRELAEVETFHARERAA